MKISYKHLVRSIDSNPDIAELSEKFFQLGHEHEVADEIFNMEITPNRGDCLSLNGLLRDLRVFYDTTYQKEVFDKKIKPFKFKFLNEAKDSCKNISFLKVDVDEIPENYEDYLEEYFSDLDIKKINFFTDVSNFLSYETGQPTHCYDSSKINGPIKLSYLKSNCVFETLLDKKINLEEGDLVFLDKDGEVINLAGIVGGKNTECNAETKSVIIECAHFNPEDIIGKSVKYDIASDAAYKFERNTDSKQHEYVLGRFLNIIQRHCKINRVELFTEAQDYKDDKSIEFDVSKVNEILGIDINDDECFGILEKLGFRFIENMIEIPSFRNDVNSINDISEEVARSIGYDNINPKTKDIDVNNNFELDFEERKLKKILVEEGFNEVVNNPFVSAHSKESVKIDNPLDSNKQYLRTQLKDSLVNCLLFNERRQKDIIKLFEISDVYSSKDRFGKRVIGIIASGRVAKNYKDFAKKINKNYLSGLIEQLNIENYSIEEISRDSLNSKSKNQIIYCELEINSDLKLDGTFDNINICDLNNIQYKPISEFPSSFRDLSFSISDFSKYELLENFVMKFNHKYLKEVFIFDYFRNEKKQEIKIGFRFIFQSSESTLTDNDVNDAISTIIDFASSVSGISIPGLD